MTEVKMLTAQEIVNKVASFLRAQGQQATSDEVCAYITPEGFRCAIGSLMPEEVWNSLYHQFDKSDGYLYDPLSKLEEFNTRPFASYCEALYDHGIDIEEHQALLEGLQDCHDSARSSFEWEEDYTWTDNFNKKLKDLCKTYELVYPEEKV